MILIYRNNYNDLVEEWYQNAGSCLKKVFELFDDKSGEPLYIISDKEVVHDKESLYRLYVKSNLYNAKKG